MILPLKTFMVKQNLQSWFLDMSPPSPQVADPLNKATLPFLTALASWLLAFEWQAAKPELGNTATCWVCNPRQVAYPLSVPRFLISKIGLQIILPFIALLWELNWTCLAHSKYSRNVSYYYPFKNSQNKYILFVHTLSHMHTHIYMQRKWSWRRNTSLERAVLSAEGIWLRDESGEFLPLSVFLP